jgi:hypothetical protein
LRTKFIERVLGQTGKPDVYNKYNLIALLGALSFPWKEAGLKNIKDFNFKSSCGVE